MNAVQTIYPYFSHLAKLKKSLLLYDSVGILDYNNYFLDSEVDSDFQNEFEFLKDQKLVWLFDTPDWQPKEANGEQRFREERKKFMSQNKINIDFIDDILSVNMALFCTYREENPIDTHFVAYSSDSLKSAETKNKILELVISQLPIPDGNTSWEDILNFRNDRDNQGRLAGLKVWMNEAIHSNLSVSEIKDKLEYQLYLYEKTLVLHNIKYKKGILRTFFVRTAETIENIARFKFSKIADDLFKVDEKNGNLLELQLTAPGKELAYIYEAKKEFQKS